MLQPWGFYALIWIELASAVRPTQILGLEVERKHVPLPLLFLDAFQCAILLACSHLFAFVKYSTKCLQDQVARMTDVAYL